MNEIAIKKHNFDAAKNRIKEFSEKSDSELNIELVETSGGFLGLGNHMVTGRELNERITAFQKYLIDINKINNDTIKEFREVYNTFDILDKDYISSIVASVEAIKKNKK